jgi:hypothetical protein
MQIMTGSFSDERGTEPIEVQSDGTSLRTRIRGVEFAGLDFDALTPAVVTEAFELHQGDLCRCTFNLSIPVQFRTPSNVRMIPIHAEIKLGGSDPRGGLDAESVRLWISEPELRISSTGSSGWFENEMLDLVRQLPDDIRVETCITCGLSDYSPYGHGLFGGLACFRDAKDAYRLVRSKQEIFALWNRLTEYVQETHHCRQFEDRPKGRGYRG